MDYFFLITLLTVAAMCDLVYAKIPNKIIIFGLVLALISCVGIKGIEEIGKYFAGMCISFLTGMVVYAFGILGAGDIKLICIVGAFLGVRGVLGSIIIAFLVSIVEGGFKYIIAERWRRFPKERMTIRFALPMLLGTLGEIWMGNNR